MLQGWGFSNPVFYNIFTTNTIGMWEKSRGFYLHAGVLSPYWASITMDYCRKNQTLRTNFYENPLEFLGFGFTPGNSKQIKATPVKIPQNCVTPNRNFKA